jgi:zeta-carotene desaturase
LPSPLHLVAGVLSWKALSWRDKLSILRMGQPIRHASLQQAGSDVARPASGPPGESEHSGASREDTVTQWLVRHGQTARLRELLWDPLALAALNQPPESAAAAPFACVLGEMFGGDATAAAIVLPNRPLHLMYAEPAREYIEARGGHVRTGVQARVRLDRGQVAAIEPPGSENHVPAAVICAVPWFALRDTLVGDTTAVDHILTAADGTRPSPIVTVNLWYDRAVMDEAFIGLPGRLMQWVFDKRTLVGSSLSHLSLVSSGAEPVLRWTNDALIEAARSEIAEALPRVRDAALLRATVIREPRATFSLAPGQPARPDVTTAVPGLFLAGDWIGNRLPATIEAAVRSGHRAADAALAACAR